jgi:hypothetical protein
MAHPKPRRWKPVNYSKYRGDINDIVARSSWEVKFMNWCDQNESVLEWGSEVVIIPYISPVDKRPHRYFVDFFIKVKDKNGDIKKYLIEIKPKRYTMPPPIPHKKTKKFIEEVFQYGVNEAKWKAADSFCTERGWKFLVLTEDHLGITK